MEEVFGEGISATLATDASGFAGTSHNARGQPQASVASRIAASAFADEGELLVTHRQSSKRRARIEDFIRSEFREHFGARIEGFMPTLVGLHDAKGEVLGAVGCRGAAHERLFLETYTHAPIETVIRNRLGISVPRREIVEVGSLACRNGRVAMAMVQALVPHLLQAGFSWVVFTGADTVVRVFRRLHLAPRELCLADKSMLDENQRGVWGSYYDHDPRVMAGPLLDGIQTLGRQVTKA